MDIGRMEKLKEIVRDRIKHIAFIMDGNRRWAVRNGLNKLEGHRNGVKALLNVLEWQKKLGIKVMTFYALSRDNKKKRSREEYESLMDLFNEYFEKLKKRINDVEERFPKVRVSVFGRYKELREDVVEKIDKIIGETSNNDAFFVNFCINYDGQDEIVYATKRICDRVIKGELDLRDIDEGVIKKHIYNSEFPAPEVIVRTGDSPRLSGFMLWDSMYSEIYFSKKMWPDFGTEELFNVIEWFAGINRKFGR